VVSVKVTEPVGVVLGLVVSVIAAGAAHVIVGVSGLTVNDVVAAAAA
jgi:hypothetical protein